MGRIAACARGRDPTTAAGDDGKSVSTAAAASNDRENWYAARDSSAQDMCENRDHSRARWKTEPKTTNAAYEPGGNGGNSGGGNPARDWRYG